MPETEPQREATPRQLIEVDNELMEDILEIVRSRSDFLLLNILRDLYSSDIAHIMNRLDMEEAEYVFGILPSDTASEVLLELDDSYREHLLKIISQPKLTELVDNMDSDDAADILGELPEETAEKLLETMDVEDSSHVEELLRYDESTAGGLMAKEFAAVHPKDTVKQAIRVVRKMAKEHKNIYNIYVVDDIGTLLGSVGLQDLLLYAPNKRIRKLMTGDVLSVTTDVDQEEVAQLFRKYDVVALPVTDKAGKLLGRITVDDIVDVLNEEHDEDVARMVGSDADELERRSPARIALLRLPWERDTASNCCRFASARRSCALRERISASRDALRNSMAVRCWASDVRATVRAACSRVRCFSCCRISRRAKTVPCRTSSPSSIGKSISLPAVLKATWTWVSSRFPEIRILLSSRPFQKLHAI